MRKRRTNLYIFVVQEMVQAMLRVDLRAPIKIHVPLDPQTTGIKLTTEADATEPTYKLCIALTQQVDNRPFTLTMNMFFTAAQASAYLPTPDVDRDLHLPGWSASTRKDSHCAKPVTLALHAVTLTQTLQHLFSATHVPLLAEVASQHTHADIVLTKVTRFHPLSSPFMSVTIEP